MLLLLLLTISLLLASILLLLRWLLLLLLASRVGVSAEFTISTSPLLLAVAGLAVAGVLLLLGGWLLLVSVAAAAVLLLLAVLLHMLELGAVVDDGLFSLGNNKKEGIVVAMFCCIIFRNMCAVASRHECYGCWGSRRLVELNGC